MFARMSISNEDIKVDWELGDTLAITMDGDGDGSDSDGTDGDSSGGDGSDGDGGDGGDADGGDA
jgi:hypothetical protein